MEDYDEDERSFAARGDDAEMSSDEDAETEEQIEALERLRTERLELQDYARTERSQHRAAQLPPAYVAGRTLADELDVELDSRLQAAQALVFGGAPAPAAAGESASASASAAASHRTRASAGAPPGAAAADEADEYDGQYFDSDDEGKDTPAGHNQRRKRTDNELLYDPDADDDDERWIESIRAHGALPMDFAEHSAAAAARKSNRERGLAPAQMSDAVLNCPACMTAVCLDCQRHEVYESQYRAMFVLNCEVQHNETVYFKEPGRGKGKGKGKRRQKLQMQVGSEDDEAGDGSEPFNPVACAVCSTVIAVYDQDEVYHFFNVLASSA